jgi:hypothetical protein
MALFLADQAVRATRRFTVWTGLADEDSAPDGDEEVAADDAQAEPDEREFVDLDADEVEPGSVATFAAPPGRPPAPAKKEVRTYTLAELDEQDAEPIDDAPAPRRARKAPPRTARSTLALMAPDMVGTELSDAADDLPDDREAWIEAWNGMMVGDAPTGAVGRAVGRHGRERVYTLLRTLLGT